MPLLDEAFVHKPTKTTIHIALEPVQNGLNSLLLFNKVDMLSGYGEWITETAVSLTPTQRHLNQVVLEGLHYAVIPTQSWSSFPAYLEYLQAQKPESLRNRVFAAYDAMPCRSDNVGPTNLDQVLANPGTFLDYLYVRFPETHIKVSVETEAYRLLKDPPVMKQTIIDHLREMWDSYLSAEWRRTLPMLQASVNAYNQLDLSNMTPLEVAQKIIGHELPEKWTNHLLHDDLDQIIFVPSAHLGPYLGKFLQERTLRLFFGARQPQGISVGSPDLSRSDLLVRLNALADDTRLRILTLLKEENELCSPEIIDQLTLSQSAASRHLKQLSATGYLVERRREGAKCYCLNLDRIEDTLYALSQFLMG